jgi:pimeloyl-ACP methyl ester carboxylesterase
VRLRLLISVLLFAAHPALADDAESTDVAKPAALVADAIPAVPTDLAAQTRPYMEFRSASFSDWNPQDRSMLIATRFGNTTQVHRVAHPGMARTQLNAAQCTVAISNFVTFLENTQGYRRELRRVEYGDGRITAQRANLIEISPMTRSTALRIPLMVVAGGSDPRVPASEADQMVKAMRANGGLAWHLLGENEGHGCAKKENQDYQFWTTLMFWQKTLLGGQ